MGHPSTLYRFRIALSDVDRDVYDSLDFRVAMHPSEAPPFLLTRVIAFALNWSSDVAPELEFTPGGLSDPDEPCIRRVKGGGAGIATWIEIGNPSARKLHRAAKSADDVQVFTYKDPGALLRELEGENVHRRSEIRVFALDSRFLGALEKRLERDNRWTVLRNDGVLTIVIGDDNFEAELKPLDLNPNER